MSRFFNRQWEPAYQDQDCDWCGAVGWTDGEVMCNDCFRQAVEDDLVYAQDQEEQQIAEGRLEDEAMAAIKRSMDALHKT